MAHNLPVTAYALLGLLTFGDELTGYELKQRADVTLRFYWVSPAMSQIYSELARLTGLGLVGRRVGRRRRHARAYRITDEGRADAAGLDERDAGRLPGAQAPGGAAAADRPPRATRRRPARCSRSTSATSPPRRRDLARGARVAAGRGRARARRSTTRRWSPTGGSTTSTARRRIARRTLRRMAAEGETAAEDDGLRP